MKKMAWIFIMGLLLTGCATIPPWPFSFGGPIGQASLVWCDPQHRPGHVPGKETLMARSTYGITAAFATRLNRGWNVLKEVLLGTKLYAQLPTIDEAAGLAANSPTEANPCQTLAQMTAHIAVATAHHTNANDPTASQKLALAGTVGTPSGTNQFATADDMGVARAENTDGKIPCSVTDALAISGTWTPAYNATAHSHEVTRTAAAASEVVAIPLRAPGLRTTASKGRKITGVRVAYQNSGALAVDFDVDVFKRPLPANGANAHANGASLKGATTYDADHDTPAKRYAAGNHCMQVTFETPAYLDGGELTMEATANDTGGAGTATTCISGIELLYSETLID